MRSRSVSKYSIWNGYFVTVVEKSNESSDDTGTGKDFTIYFARSHWLERSWASRFSIPAQTETDPARPAWWRLGSVDLSDRTGTDQPGTDQPGTDLTVATLLSSNIAYPIELHGSNSTALLWLMCYLYTFSPPSGWNLIEIYENSVAEVPK